MSCSALLSVRHGYFKDYAFLEAKDWTQLSNIFLTVTNRGKMWDISINRLSANSIKPESTMGGCKDVDCTVLSTEEV